MTEELKKEQPQKIKKISMIQKLGMIGYCLLFFCFCLLPLIMMPFFPGETEREAHGIVAQINVPASVSVAEAAAASSEIVEVDTVAAVIETETSETSAKAAAGMDVTDFTESKVVIAIENYFNTHYGLRRQMIAFDAEMKRKIFGESSNEKVLIGKEGWLYLAETVDPASTAYTYSKRTIQRIVRTLELQKEYLDKNETAFLFVPAPNKASVYSEFLPYYAQIPKNSETLLAALLKALAVSEVPVLDVIPLLKTSTNEMLHNNEGQHNNDVQQNNERQHNQQIFNYHKLDSHWNYLGARTVYQAILEKISTLGYIDSKDAQFDMYQNLEPTMLSDWAGDLESMLNPESQIRDLQFRFDIPKEFQTRKPLVNEEDLNIVSSSQKNDIRLLFFRDSFANSLIQFFSNNFGDVEYTRAIPYPISRTENGRFDLVILEIVERNLTWMIHAAPVMPAPVRGIDIDIYKKVQNMDSDRQGSLSVFGMSVVEENREKIVGYFDPVYLISDTVKIYPVFEPINSENVTNETNPENRFIFEAFPILEQQVQNDAIKKHGSQAMDCGFSFHINDEMLPVGNYQVKLLFIDFDRVEAIESNVFMLYQKAE